MSDFLAIGGVSNTLRNLLLNRMEMPPGVSDDGFCITIGNPAINTDLTDKTRINIFLYKIEENPSLINQEIPGASHSGGYGHPPLSLNLYYLITSYGFTIGEEDNIIDETRAQQALGSCMLVLHDNAIITDSIQPGTILDPSLQNEFENIKITLEPISIDDLSKLWSTFSTPIKTSVAYRISIIQIESRYTPPDAKPVLKRRIVVSTKVRPSIREIFRSPSENKNKIYDRVAIGEKLTIIGNNYKGEKTYVVLGELEPIEVLLLSNNKIEIDVPEDDRLQIGQQIIKVKVVRKNDGVEGGLDKGKTIEEHITMESDLASFILVPGISEIDPTNGNSSTPILTVNGTRLYKAGATTIVIINDIQIEVDIPGTDTQIQIPLAQLIASTSSLDPGNYPFSVSVMVDDVQSIDEVIYTFEK